MRWVLAFIRTQPGLRARHRRYGTPLTPTLTQLTRPRGLAAARETDTACNAFTYNQAQNVCFLKRAASQWTTFYAWGITGIKLSPLAPSE